jgi:hypothetical protein
MPLKLNSSGSLRRKVSFHSYVRDGLQQEGAPLLTGGLPPDDGPLAAGYFMERTVISHVSNEWRISREEIFGPVMVAIPWNGGGRGDRRGKWKSLWTGCFHLDTPHWKSYSYDPRPRIRLGPEQPGHGNHARSILWRV